MTDDDKPDFTFPMIAALAVMIAACQQGWDWWQSQQEDESAILAEDKSERDRSHQGKMKKIELTHEEEMKRIDAYYSKMLENICKEKPVSDSDKLNTTPQAMPYYYRGNYVVNIQPMVVLAFNDKEKFDLMAKLTTGKMPKNGKLEAVQYAK